MGAVVGNGGVREEERPCDSLRAFGVTAVVGWRDCEHDFGRCRPGASGQMKSDSPFMISHKCRLGSMGPTAYDAIEASDHVVRTLRLRAKLLIRWSPAIVKIMTAENGVGQGNLDLGRRS